MTIGQQATKYLVTAYKKATGKPIPPTDLTTQVVWMTNAIGQVKRSAIDKMVRSWVESREE